MHAENINRINFGIMKQKLNRWIQAGFYCFAGINHLFNPEFYYDLIPSYFIYLDEINLLAGVAEIVLGIGLIFKEFRKISAYGIMLMLLTYIPSHIYFIQIGSCIEGGLCVPAWLGWFRLVVIHPLLIFWAWSARK